jgi:hypothetical protein
MKRRLLATATAFARPHLFEPFDRDGSRGRASHRERRRFKTSQTNGGSAGNTATTQQSQQQQNDAAQRTVLAMARPMIQQFGVMPGVPGGANAALGGVYTQVLQNVGLNTKLTIEVSGTISAAAAETLKKTPFGLSNALSNIQLTDLSNYQRVNAYGCQLFLLNSLRKQQPWGCAYVNDSPVNMGSTWLINNAPAAVVGAAAVPFRIFYEVPLAYHDYDLRGAIYAQVTSAQWRLQVTVNPNFVVGSGAADTLFNCFQSTTANNVGNVSISSIQVYQHYLDQIPPGPNGMPVLPLLSLAWNYLILNAPQTGILQSNDFPVQYANFRTFLSTIAIFDNAGTFNTGSDVNYVGIQVANQTFLEKLDPYMATLKARMYFGDDPPPGVYVFDHRRWPIVTNQFGNTQFVLNANQVNNGASLQMFYEMLSVQAQAINAGSLAAS